MTPRIYLADTNVISRYCSGRDPALVKRFREHAADLRLSSVAWFELRYGTDKRPDLPALGQRLLMLREILPHVVPMDEDSAWHAARIRAALANLKPSPLPIGPYDVLLAGQALSLGAILVTHNTKEFSRVRGLALEDWQSTH